MAERAKERRDADHHQCRRDGFDITALSAATQLADMAQQLQSHQRVVGQQIRQTVGVGDILNSAGVGDCLHGRLKYRNVTRFERGQPAGDVAWRGLNER